MYLDDLEQDPSLLDRFRKESKSRQQQREREEDEMYEELGRLIEEHPIPSGGIRRG